MSDTHSQSKGANNGEADEDKECPMKLISPTHDRLYNKLEKCKERMYNEFDRTVKPGLDFCEVTGQCHNFSTRPRTGLWLSYVTLVVSNSWMLRNTFCASGTA